MVSNRYFDEYIRKLEEKLQSLRGSISAEKYVEISQKLEGIRSAGIDLADDFDVSELDNLVRQAAYLEAEELSDEVVRQSAKDTKRDAFLQRLQFILNRVGENVGAELEEVEQYWASIESYYDELERRGVRDKLDEIRLEVTLKAIQDAKVVDLGAIDVNQNYFLIRERLLRLAENAEISKEERLLINTWLGESINIKSGGLDEEAMAKIVKKPKLWCILSGVEEVRAESVKENALQPVKNEEKTVKISKLWGFLSGIKRDKRKASKKVVEQKKQEAESKERKPDDESEERKQEITAVCARYGVKESEVRALLKRSEDDICIIKLKKSYKVVYSKDCHSLEGARSVRAVIYNNGNTSGIYKDSKEYEYSDVCEIVLPDHIQEIGPEAFMNYNFLERIRLPAQIRKIGERAFYNTRIGEIELPDSLEDLGEKVFRIVL